MILITSMWYTKSIFLSTKDPSLELCIRFTLFYVLLWLGTGFIYPFHDFINISCTTEWFGARAWEIELAEIHE